MHYVYDTGVGKKTTTLTINADLVAKAKALDINMSALLEQALVQKIREKERESWARENSPAIGLYNRSVEEFGVFSEEMGEAP